MSLHLTFNTHDIEALEAIVGPPPPDVAEKMSRGEDIAPGHVLLELGETVKTIEVGEFDILTAGIMLARYAQQDDREAIKSWPLQGDLDFESEAYQALVGCSNDTVKATAQSYVFQTELNQAILDAVDVVVIDMRDLNDLPETAEPVHPETLTEHGGEG